jgi:Fe-Mn family superoxide dismutase
MDSSWQQPDANGHFNQAPLPYATDALEPVIDAETMALHHGRHHAAYVKKLNALLSERPALQGKSLPDLLARASSLPLDIRNNAGQHHAHSLFFETMAPNGEGGDPSAALADAITRDFGSLEAMKAAFEAAATAHFGTGWAWLVKAGNGRLVVGTTPDGDTPAMDAAALKGTPILVQDLWEHAWYLKYRNEKAKYLAAWWSVVDWGAASRRFAP